MYSFVDIAFLIPTYLSSNQDFTSLLRLNKDINHRITRTPYTNLNFIVPLRTLDKYPIRNAQVIIDESTSIEKYIDRITLAIITSPKVPNDFLDKLNLSKNSVTVYINDIYAISSGSYPNLDLYINLSCALYPNKRDKRFYELENLIREGNNIFIDIGDAIGTSFFEMLPYELAKLCKITYDRSIITVLYDNIPVETYPVKLCGYQMVMKRKKINTKCYIPIETQIIYKPKDGKFLGIRDPHDTFADSLPTNRTETKCIYIIHGKDGDTRRCNTKRYNEYPYCKTHTKSHLLDTSSFKIKDKEPKVLCIAITRMGHQCQNRQKEGNYCGIHSKLNK